MSIPDLFILESHPGQISPSTSGSWLAFLLAVYVGCSFDSLKRLQDQLPTQKIKQATSKLSILFFFRSVTNVQE